MSKLDVRIVRLEPMRVASAYGFGASPEGIAHEKMQALLRAKKLLDGYSTKYRHFGFNNPSPAPGSPNYGYEIWVEIAMMCNLRETSASWIFPAGCTR